MKNVLGVQPGASKQQQPEQKTGFTKPFNKNGKEIQFDFIKSDKEHINQGRNRQKKILSKLSMEYNTRLETVSGGAHKAAGDVDITGQAMRLSSTTLDTAIHEFAHTLANTDADKFGLTADNEFWNEVRKIRTEYRKALRNDPSKSISSYATGSKELDEFMAEAFTHAKAKQLGINLPHNYGNYGNDYTYSNKVLAVVDKYFGKSLTNANKSSTIQSGMKNVYTYGHRNEKTLTDEQYSKAVEAARKQGYKGSIGYSDHVLTGILNLQSLDGTHNSEGSLLVIGTDVYPIEEANTANEKLTLDCCMAHEVIGHHGAWLRNTTQSDDLLEEVQASLRGSLFGVGLSDEERQLLEQDAMERLEKANIKYDDVKDKLDIREK